MGGGKRGGGGGGRVIHVPTSWIDFASRHLLLLWHKSKCITERKGVLRLPDVKVFWAHMGNKGGNPCE